MSLQETQDEIENRAVKESMSCVNSGNWGMDRHVVKALLISKSKTTDNFTKTITWMLL